MKRMSRLLGQALVVGGILLTLAQAQAETIVATATGSPNAIGWPFYVALKKGFFAAQDITIEVVAASSSTAAVLQAAAGSAQVSSDGALADVIRAIDKGAPLAILRIVVQAPPFELLAKPSIKTLKDLKRKTISIGGSQDVTHIYLDRMLEANGLKDGDVDLVYAGSSSARLAALESGAVDAAILTSPFNFYGVTAGFPVIGRTVDYVKDLPQSSTAVNRNWAASHMDTVRKYLAAFNKGVDWLRDRHNRDAAIAILAEAGKLKPVEVAKSYDFFVGGDYFEPTDVVSKAKLRSVAKVVRKPDDVSNNVDIGAMFLPGVTKIGE
jgi:NitT/TauT family transport system substrate-binding protein